MSQMTTTARLLRVYRVDEQLKGLESRLRAAERFLKEQDSQLGQIETKRKGLESQLRQLKATIANTEGEIKGFDQRMESLRQKMGNAQTSREHKAFLTELNTIKADRDKVETAGLESMAKADALAKELETLGGKRDEREKVRGVAASERNQRADEIRTRVEELRAQRAALVSDVPADALRVYNDLMAVRGEEEEIMCVVEVSDFKRHEYNCSGCMKSLPLEVVSALLSKGTLTRCKSCGLILFLSDETVENMSAAIAKK
jgi:predicted  nucleic acid-binding Zn-ribbon protein